MGKNVSLYLDDESDELVGSIDGRGTLINRLIKDHFSNDEDVLRRKLITLDRDINVIKKKLEDKANDRLRREANMTELTRNSQYKQDKFNKAKKLLEEQVKAKKITFEEFRLKTAMLKDKLNIK